MLFATTGAAEAEAETVLSTTELMNAQRLTRLIPVGEQVVDAILKLVRGARPSEDTRKSAGAMITRKPLSSVVSVC